MLVLRGDFYAALKELDRATALDERLPYPYRYRGDIFFRKGDSKRAIENYSRYLQLHPEAPDGGEVYSRLKVLRSLDSESES